MRFYGENFLVGIVGKNKEGHTVKYIVEEYLNWSKNFRQNDRTSRDYEYLKNLDKKKKYEYAVRQYSGHSYIPQTTQGMEKRIFISDAISW